MTVPISINCLNIASLIVARIQLSSREKTGGSTRIQLGLLFDFLVSSQCYPHWDPSLVLGMPIHLLTGKQWKTGIPIGILAETFFDNFLY